MDTENVPLRAADQAALLLDWGFAVPAGTEGVGRLVRPADLAVPTAAPTTSPTRTRSRTGTRTGPARPRRPAASHPLVPAALAGAAVLIVVATLIGVVGPCARSRRHAVRRRRRASVRGGDTLSIRRRVDVHAAVKKANRATRLIQTSRPTAPPNADAVTLSLIRTGSSRRSA